jgi:hypothetical protein
VIRQAISCDICGTEKRQTNHWFVAYEQSGELRVSGFASRRRGRAGSKHLCGQTCLHKLVDEFMATSIAARSRPPIDEGYMEAPILPGTIHTASAAPDAESSARLITPASRALPLRALRAQPEVVAMPPRLLVEDSPPIDDPPHLSSASRQAEAWQRERERESRSAGAASSAARRSLAHRGA